MTAYRQVQSQLNARPTSDGDGVKLKRVFGGANPESFDPFLMMDEFGSDSADDYIGGFPAHPHRGFETITYMLQGKIEHQDHLGNKGLLTDGGVQWMTAGRGIIHSEMPKQTEGLMRGFQIWLNLPAKDKMQRAHYEDIAPTKIPQFKDDQCTLKAIAGQVMLNGHEVAGYVSRPHTQPIVLDVHIEPGKTVTIDLPSTHRCMVYVYEGDVLLGGQDQSTAASRGIMSTLSDAGNVLIRNADATGQARIILLAGQPLREPIAHYGPFVMNTPEEIEQAMMDYRSGKLTA